MTARRSQSVGVVIPAHDEADHIADTIGSVLGALDVVASAGAAPGRSLVVVVADTCGDRTADIARRALGSRGVVVEVTARCVGTARAVGSTAALGLLDAPADQIWLANTDADSIVPTTWLARQLAAARTGAECVAGIVGLVGGPGGHLHDAFRSTYALGVGSRRHRHVHGANLGIGGDLLDRLGNWAPLLTGEDRDLWDRAGRAGARRRADAGLVVLTSARTLGRAPAGFARDLRALTIDLGEASACLAPGVGG